MEIIRVNTFVLTNSPEGNQHPFSYARPGKRKCTSINLTLHPIHRLAVCKKAKAKSAVSNVVHHELRVETRTSGPGCVT
jgi:hypothetical protein